MLYTCVTHSIRISLQTYHPPYPANLVRCSIRKQNFRVRFRCVCVSVCQHVYICMWWRRLQLHASLILAFIYLTRNSHPHFIVMCTAKQIGVRVAFVGVGVVMGCVWFGFGSWCSCWNGGMAQRQTEPAMFCTEMPETRGQSAK